ncbi:MAG: LacI family transcriptional regulator [Paenibacillus sp.]|nr:LacI family transcriptional regulator [Paenibacillus sp.]
MPTIKDIALAAGVSHGTASNVLNGKGNVSLQKIKRVEAAAKKLGYTMNVKAKSLRSGTTNTVSILLPTIECIEYVQLYKGLEQTLTKLGFRVQLHITYDVPYMEKKIITEIAEERVIGIVTISCLDDANLYYEEIDIPKKNIVFVNRMTKHAKTKVSFNFQQAGADVGGYLAKHQPQASVGVFSDELKFSNEKQFVDAIVKELPGRAIQCLHVPFSQSPSQSFHFFSASPPDVIVTSSMYRAECVRKAHYWGSGGTLPKIVTLGPTHTTPDEPFIVYQQNYDLFGQDIAALLIDRVHDRPAVKKTLYSNEGMRRWNITESGNAQTSLALLTIESPTTDALKKLAPHFTKCTGTAIEIIVKTYEEMYQLLEDEKQDRNHCGYDMIRMDMAWLPWFGKEVYRPLQQLDPWLDDWIQSLSPHIQAHYSQIEHAAYALPFDPSVQMLFYRKDIFEDPKIKRLYYEKTKKQLSVPEDFDSFNEIVQFFSADGSDLSPTKYGTSVTLGIAEIVAAEFLSRYYAEKGSLVAEQGIELDHAVAIKALTNYLQTVAYAQRLDAAWWGEAVSSFARGETAMVIGFRNQVSRIANSEYAPVITATSVPGNRPLLGGGVIGISKHSQRVQEAIHFFKWVHADEIAAQISELGGISANPNADFHSTFFHGIRDTRFKDGSGVDMKKLEHMIGVSIMEAIRNRLSAVQTIERIHFQLSRQFSHSGKSN